MELKELTLNELLALLDNRGWGDKHRLMRKVVEECGEYFEAVEYELGSSGKTKKFKGIATPIEKLQEEICDVVMMALAVARKDGLSVEDVLDRIKEKLIKKETEFAKKAE